ncbi:hypothetical protein STXM2123_461 [Streptomyces sp. F-3]|nr:hypothetical protein STXM2123_461 [Streptomyces sp. F-3]
MAGPETNGSGVATCARKAARKRAAGPAVRIPGTPAAR